jgi:predicted transcriptional regulator of viral defense system
MKSEKTVSQYLEELARSGQYYFVLDELVNALGHKKNSVSVSLSRLAKAGKVQMIRKGFGIFTANTNGPLDPSFFLDAMMKNLDAKYYVGLLNAAAYKGASHQAVMTYTVVTEKFLKPIKLQGLTIDFITKKHFEDLTEIEKVGGRGGYFYISSPELTAIDLIRFPKKSGQLNNIATVLSELNDSIKKDKLKNICEKSRTPIAALQRLGYILDVVLEEKTLSECIFKVALKRKMQLVPLSIGKNVSKESIIDKKWNLKINAQVEPDE